MTFLVKNTNDSGQWSLRQAILDSNAATPGPNSIVFKINSPGVQLIQPSSQLPAIKTPVTIDARTEAAAQNVAYTTPLIHLAGGNINSSGNIGFDVRASQTTIEGFIINGFPLGIGIELNGTGATGDIIQGNWIGTSIGGLTAPPPADNNNIGIKIIDGASSNLIGGSSSNVNGILSGAGNLISGNTKAGILFTGTNSTTDTNVATEHDNIIEGNYIGTDVTGTAAIPNDPSGTYTDDIDLLDDSINNTIGGASQLDGNGNLQGLGNLISASGADGIFLSDYVRSGHLVSGNLIEGNFIGTDVTGTRKLGNKGNGILVDAGVSSTTIGGTQAGTGNVIAASTGTSADTGPLGNGVLIAPVFGFGTVSGTVIEGNKIGTDVTGTRGLGNQGNGIEEAGGAFGNTVGGGNLIAENTLDGVLISGSTTTGNTITQNSIFNTSSTHLSIDLANGGNSNQAAPWMTSAISSGGNTSITGTLVSTANTSITVEFFASVAGSPAQGQTYLGRQTITTNGSGQGNVAAAFAPPIAAGWFLTATVTNNATHNTSGFSQSVKVAVPTKLVFGGPVGNAVAGQALSPAVTVQVLDQDGSLIAGDNIDQVTVVANGPGAFTSGSVATALVVGGVATFDKLALNKAGNYTAIIASAPNLTSATSNSFVISPAVASQLVMITQPSATATAGKPFTTQPVLQVQDTFGNPITGDSTHTVTAASTGTAGLQGNTTITLANGMATFSGLSYNKAETIQLHFTTNAGSFTQNSTNVLVNPGPLAQLSFLTAPQNLMLGTLSATMTVQFADQFGNPVGPGQANPPIGLSSSAGTGTFWDTVGTTSITSLAVSATTPSYSFKYKDTAAGSPILTATWNSGNPLTASQTESVGRLDTTTSLNSPTVTYNAPGTVTVTVSSTGGTPTGTVMLLVDGSQLSGTLNGNGVAAFPLGSLNAGDHPLHASYAQQGNFAGSTADGTLQVNPAATSVTITAPAITYNANGGVTVMVSSLAGTPTGTVNLSVDGGAALTQNLTNGSATFTLSSPNAGDHTLHADYPAQGNYAHNTADGTLHADPAATTVRISAPTVTYNANGVVTLTVSSTAGTPSGTITLSVDGGAALTQALTNGTATFTIPSPSAGDHTLHANYPAQGNFAGESADGTLHVNPAATNMSLSAPTITYNGNGLVTVTVSPQQAGVPTVTGNVTLSVDGGSLQTGSLDAGGRATFTLTSPSAGSHSLSATYAAQGNYDTSSATGNLTVNPAPTSVTLGAPAITYNANGAVTVTVSPQQAGVPTVTGTVTLSMDGGTPQSGALNASGQATFSVDNPSAGDHTLHADYAPQGNFAGSAADGTLHVSPAPTNVSLSAPTVTYNANGVVTLTVSPQQPGVPTVTGNVTLSVDGGPSQSAALNASGQATFTLTSPSAGSHALSASYAAQGNYAAGAASGSLTVNQAATTLTLSAPTITYNANAAVTLTVRSTAGTPIGNVSLSVDGGAALTQTLNNGSATFTLSGLSAGDHNLSANYAGAGNFASSGPTTGPLSVQAADTTLTASNASGTFSLGNQTITLSGSLSSSAGPVSGGTITFTIAGVGAATSGPVANRTASASLTLPGGTPTGSYTIQAVYSGTTNYHSSSDSSHSLTVTAAAGQVQFASATYSGDENAGSLTITVSRTGGTAGGVTVQYATVDGTAQAGRDYTAASGTLTFGLGETSKMFTVPVLDNGLVTLDGLTVNLTLSQPGGGATLGAPATAVLTIADDDLPVVPDSPPPVTLTAAATAFAHSREHFTQFVTNAYQQYLKRLPDSAGLDFWVTNMQAGVYSDEQLEAFFIGSAEYIADHGGTGQAWVTSMYQDLLGRTPAASEVQGWVNALNSGTSPATVALGFAASAEREGQRVRFNYRTYLGREAQPAEVTEWVNAFLGGLTNEGMIGGFVGSPEYYLSSSKGRNNEARWVARAYLDVLFRPARVGEVNNWLNFLG
jgi:hypothetical protein